VNRRGKDVQDRGAVSETAVSAAQKAPPEETGRAGEHDVLQRVYATVAHGSLVERRQMPDPQRQGVHPKRDHWRRQERGQW
jgi:hypothetical protein